MISSFVMLSLRIYEPFELLSFCYSIDFALIRLVGGVDLPYEPFEHGPLYPLYLGR